MDQSTDSEHLWLWIGIGVGVALGAAGAVYLAWQSDAPHRLERLLRRCEDRIQSIEGSLAKLEPALGPAES